MAQASSRSSALETDVVADGQLERLGRGEHGVAAERAVGALAAI